MRSPRKRRQLLQARAKIHPAERRRSGLPVSKPDLIQQLWPLYLARIVSLLEMSPAQTRIKVASFSLVVTDRLTGNGKAKVLAEKGKDVILESICNRAGVRAWVDFKAVPDFII